MSELCTKRMDSAHLFDKFYTSELFHDVQMSGLFYDSKTFADAQPLSDLTKILQRYDRDKVSSDFSLAEFVQQHFTLPSFDEIISNLPKTTVNQHIEALWPLLCKNPTQQNNDSLLPLAHPYIVPGGRFREIYYWDSYFTALGLIESGRIDIATAMLENFIDLITHYDIIPNGNRRYYLSRSQPPVLALFVELLLPFHQGDSEFLSRCINAIKREHEFWMRDSENLSTQQPALSRVVRLQDGSVLNRYWDDSATPRPESYKEDIEQAAAASNKQTFYRNLRAACESGWDFSSRWLVDSKDLTSIQTCDIIPIDLNCLLFQQESLLAHYCKTLDDDQYAYYETLASNRKDAINKYLWSQEQEFYMDFNHATNTHTPVKSLAVSVPLFTKIASQTQADKVSQALFNEFLTQGGLITTTTITTQQWDNPNGWAPLQYFSVIGLLEYQHEEFALDIANRWLSTVETYYQQTGKIMEKYNLQQTQAATGGEYDVQEGFGWTNAVCQVFYKLAENKKPIKG